MVIESLGQRLDNFALRRVGWLLLASFSLAHPINEGISCDYYEDSDTCLTSG